MRNRIRSSLASSVVVLAMGCTLINPYVSLPPRESSPSFDHSMAYASRAMDAHLDALGDHSEFRSLLGVGLIPLSAAALGLGVVGGSSVAITSIGLTAASGYGVGQWLDGTPHQKAYLAGYNAVNCAVEAVAPLDFDPDATGLNAGLASIDARIEAAQIAIAVVTYFRYDVDGDLRTRADEEIASADEVLDRAQVARTNGIRLAHERHRAPRALVATVDRIIGSVNEAIRLNEPDLEALMRIVGGLAASYSSFTAVPEGLVPPPKEKKGEKVALESATEDDPDKAAIRALQDRLIDAIFALRTATAALGIPLRQIGDVVNAIDAQKPIEKMMACGVDVSGLAPGLTIEPAGDVEFTEGKAEAKLIVIRGGRHPYHAELVDSAAGLSVAQLAPFGRDVRISTTTEVKAGEHVLLVADGGERRMLVPVKIEKTATDTTSDVPVVFAELSPADREKVLKALCQDPEQGWTPDANVALAEFQTTEDVPGERGVLTSPLANQLKELPDADVVTRCEEGTT